jgi:hypothetical protein
MHIKTKGKDVSTGKQHTMKRAILSFLLLLTVSGLFAQKGHLRIYLEGNYEYEEYTFEIWNDSLVTSQKTDDYRIDFDSLQEGLYSIRILSDKHGMPTTYHEIPIKGDSTTSLDLYVWAYDISCPNCDCDSGSSRDEVNIDFLYSSLFNENTLPVKNGFYFNYGFTPWLPIHRNFNLGFSPGIYYGFNQLDNSFNNDNEEITKQRYSNIGLSLEAKARIAFFNTKKYWTYGPFLDFGALYKLPFAFRYVQIGEAVRTRYNDLHNFQDFRLFAKLGFTPVSVRVDYRLNDFIKSGLPQQPLWSIGLSFVPEV